MNTHDVTNELHRESCAECRAVWADLERISADARALPLLSPSRDLWSGIEARIGGAGAGARAHRRWFSSHAVRLAAAASLLVAASATITWQVATRRDPASPGSGIGAVAAGAAGADAPGSDVGADLAPGTTAASPVAAFREASNAAEYARLDGEIAALRVIVDQRLARLDPATVDVLERNLALIDAAIEKSRKALLADPASRFLATELARAYSTKLDLLRTTAKLPAGT